MSASPDHLTAALESHFGFSAFRGGQRAVIEDVMEGRPTLAVMPTGAGKSVCYQLPSQLLDGVTVVISPLIALMKDQVEGLQARGLSADFINSSQSRATQRAVMEDVVDGHTKLLYVAPERFGVPGFLDQLRAANVSLFAVDEAHCISQWGHDFRPDYTRLGDVVRSLEPRCLLACTATATPQVRDDILATLNLDDPSVHVSGFLRDNLFVDVRFCRSDSAKDDRLVRFLTEGPGKHGAVIIYAATRKRVERISDLVRRRVGKDVVAYHAGMDHDRRNAAQESFMSGEARIAVATNAFGMGVDRADVRAVVHAEMPGTLEGYYQEIGRAGRDGQPSYCLLLYGANDSRIHEFFLDMSYPPRARIDAVWGLLQTLPDERYADIEDVADRLRGDGKAQVEAVFRVLREAGALDELDNGLARPVPGAPKDASRLDIDFETLRFRRKVDGDKLRLIRNYAQGQACRHEALLSYFGDQLPKACPGCDRCHDRPDSDDASIPDGEPSEAEVLIVRKALAGVARARARFGLKTVAGMLAGSRAKKIATSRLAKLSTYGILSDVGMSGCSELLALLCDRGLCQLEGRDYPLIGLSDAGQAVMKSEAPLSFRLPKHLVPGTRSSGPRRSRRDSEPSHLDAELLEVLREFRTRLASKRGVPSYVIFNNKTMDAIAAAAPTSEREFLAVSGLGPGKWSSFGEALVACVKGHGE